ncbi:MAG TPA: threonine--tRNA ligase [Candidatus Paceibacterota bacterium]|nr:threonine--tRNA ligase [Candidatus Paceibacterota bacterium]
MDQHLEHLRHSLAHLLAAAVTKLWPDAKPTIGPAIEHGFYYDFAFPSPISEADLARIEDEMRKLLPSWESFAHREVTADEARKLYKGNPFKLELVNELESKGETITVYTSGGFTDLCRGGHLAHPAKEIDPSSFALHKLAGAYWRGDESKSQLTRIYGLAFATKEELAAHLTMLQEAAKRDHKKLGPELDLFVFSDLVGSGLPLWTPKGTVLRNILDDFVWGLRAKYGYEKVEIPHITKKDLYVTSGHWEKFKEDLFRITTREDHEFAMKPMNCPHHTQIYARRLWSYRELPQRYANTTMVYRDEQSGELAGLARVRSITQDDAHVFCRMDQVNDEALKIWDIIHAFYGAFGFRLRVRLSVHDPATPEKYLGSEAGWKDAERILEALLTAKGITPELGVGEAAFYGPKLDFLGKDAIGREHQVATIQLDLNMPERFDLVCINEKGERERIVMIHAAIMGSIERFLAVAIEHFGGAFPAWLAPVQVRVIPVSDKHLGPARIKAELLRDAGIRTELDESNESVGKKIRAAETAKIPYAAVVGDKEKDSDALAVRKHGGEDVGTVPVEELVRRIRSDNPLL